MKLAQLFEKDASTAQQEMLSRIKKDCSSFLGKVTKPLYRGMNLKSSMVRRIKPGFYIGAVRPNREPKDSSKALTDAMNLMFTKEVGLPLRTASLFTSFDVKTAESYADVFDDKNTCIVFPIGEWHYAWSKEIEDPFETFENNWGDFKGIESEMIKAAQDAGLEIHETHPDWYGLSDDNDKIIDAFFKNYAARFYHFDKNISSAENSDSEIMIVCDKYYAVPTDVLDMSTEKFFELLK